MRFKKSIVSCSAVVFLAACLHLWGDEPSVPVKPSWTPEPPATLSVPDGYKEWLGSEIAVFERDYLKNREDEAKRIRMARFSDRLKQLPQLPSSEAVKSVTSRHNLSDFAAHVDQARMTARSMQLSAELSGESHVLDQYIVRFKESHFPYQGTGAYGKLQRVNSFGETVQLRAYELVLSHGGQLMSSWNRALVGFAAILTKEAAASLALLPEIESVAPNQIIRGYTDQVIVNNGLYGLDRIDEDNISTEDVYRYHSTGGPIFSPLDTGTHVYVLDSGIRETHEEFTNLGNHRNFSAETTYADGHGHGTHVAGIIAGATFGVAKDAVIHAVKVLNDNNSGIASDVIAGVDWVAEEHAANPGQRSLANLSLGAFINTTVQHDLSIAVSNLVNDGILAIVAAGNDDSKDVTKVTPAQSPEALTVGSIDIFDAKPDYSNWGPGVDVWAPGGDGPQRVLSAGHLSDSDTAEMFGTSMAAPHVTGVAARYLQENPTLSPAELHDAVVDTAVSGKIAGDLGGAANLILQYNNWWYPLNTEEEWINSDTAYSNDHWLFDSWMWTASSHYAANGDLAVYRQSDDKWLVFLSPASTPNGYEDRWVFYDTADSQFIVVFQWEMHAPTGPMIVAFPWL